VDYKKVSTTCGYKPLKKFETSLEETISWYKTNEIWWRPLKELL
jgi:dTDP-glucose 4,6-dehydratase